MRKNDLSLIVTMILGGLVYSIISFAYMHQTFPSKDTFSLVLERINEIARDVKHLRERR